MDVMSGEVEDQTKTMSCNTENLGGTSKLPKSRLRPPSENRAKKTSIRREFNEGGQGEEKDMNENENPNELTHNKGNLISKLPAVNAKTCVQSMQLHTKGLLQPTKISKTADKIPKTADKIPKTADKIPKTADKIPKTADKIPKTADKIPKTADKIPKTADKTGIAIVSAPSLSRGESEISLPCAAQQLKKTLLVITPVNGKLSKPGRSSDIIRPPISNYRNTNNLNNPTNKIALSSMSLSGTRSNGKQLSHWPASTTRTAIGSLPAETKVTMCKQQSLRSVRSVKSVKSAKSGIRRADNTLSNPPLATGQGPEAKRSYASQVAERLTAKLEKARKELADLQEKTTTAKLRDTEARERLAKAQKSNNDLDDAITDFVAHSKEIEMIKRHRIKELICEKTAEQNGLITDRLKSKLLAHDIVKMDEDVKNKANASLALKLFLETADLQRVEAQQARKSLIPILQQLVKETKLSDSHILKDRQIIAGFIMQLHLARAVRFGHSVKVTCRLHRTKPLRRGYIRLAVEDLLPHNNFNAYLLEECTGKHDKQNTCMTRGSSSDENCNKAECRGSNPRCEDSGNMWMCYEGQDQCSVTLKCTQENVTSNESAQVVQSPKVLKFDQIISTDRSERPTSLLLTNWNSIDDELRKTAEELTDSVDHSAYNGLIGHNLAFTDMPPQSTPQHPPVDKWIVEKNQQDLILEDSESLVITAFTESINASLVNIGSMESNARVSFWGTVKPQIITTPSLTSSIASQPVLQADSPLCLNGLLQNSVNEVFNQLKRYSFAKCLASLQVVTVDPRPTASSTENQHSLTSGKPNIRKSELPMAAKSQQVNSSDLVDALCLQLSKMDLPGLAGVPIHGDNSELSSPHDTDLNLHPTLSTSQTIISGATGDSNMADGLAYRFTELTRQAATNCMDLQISSIGDILSESPTTAASLKRRVSLIGNMPSSEAFGWSEAKEYFSSADLFKDIIVTVDKCQPDFLAEYNFATPHRNREVSEDTGKSHTKSKRVHIALKLSISYEGMPTGGNTSSSGCESGLKITPSTPKSPRRQVSRPNAKERVPGQTKFCDIVICDICTPNHMDYPLAPHKDSKDMANNNTAGMMNYGGEEMNSLNFLKDKHVSEVFNIIETCSQSTDKKAMLSSSLSHSGRPVTAHLTTGIHGGPVQSILQTCQNPRLQSLTTAKKQAYESSVAVQLASVVFVKKRPSLVSSTVHVTTPVISSADKQLLTLSSRWSCLNSKNAYTTVPGSTE